MSLITAEKKQCNHKITIKHLQTIKKLEMLAAAINIVWIRQTVKEKRKHFSSFFISIPPPFFFQAITFFRNWDIILHILKYVPILPLLGLILYKSGDWSSIFLINLQPNY